MYEFAGLLLARLVSSQTATRRPTLAEEDAFYAHYGEAPWQKARKVFARWSGRAKTAAADGEEEAASSGGSVTAVSCRLQDEYGEGRQNAAGGKAEGGRAPKKDAAIVLRLGNGDCACSAI